MSAEGAVLRTSARRAPGRFAADREGHAAIEFGLLALPFAAFVFAILEVALMFFVGAAMDAALQRAARTIRTGEAQASGVTLASFRAQVCAGMVGIGQCVDRLKVHVTPAASLAAAGTSALPALDAVERFDGGAAGQIMLAQVLLPWPSWFGLFASGRRERTLSASVLFRNEPYGS